MTGKMMSLDELFARDEEERLAKTRAEMAAEKAAWDALPQEEKDRITAEREAKWEAFDAACEASEAEEDDEDEEENEDEE